ncbi:MAG TPA: hypothetical protein DD396_05030 [Bacteroidetes bacterium]|jgi:hypothetical protein|nr:hypothetical protein [Bacteroidota bacterium]
MKKTLTILLSIISTMSIAQLDWAVKSIDKPVDLYTNDDGTTDVVAQVTLENLGETIPAGDTFTVALAIFRKADGALLVASQNYTLLNPSESIKGSTLTTSEISFKINGGITGTADLPIYMGALSYHRNRTSPKVDIDSSNNIILREMNWKPAGKLSLNSVAFENNISAYPNPANATINVALNYVQQGATTIEFINLNGQVVVSQNATDIFNTSNSLDVSNLKKGLYVLRITNGAATYTRKVSVTH